MLQNKFGCRLAGDKYEGSLRVGILKGMMLEAQDKFVVDGGGGRVWRGSDLARAVAADALTPAQVPGGRAAL